MSDCNCSRRQFTKRTGIIAGALGLAGLTTARAQELSPLTAGVYNVIGPGRFASVARVITVSGNQIFAANELGTVTFRVRPTVRFWRGGYYRGLGVLNPNDRIAVRGRIDTDGTLYADSIEANLGRVKGTITALSGDTMLIMNRFSTVWTVKLSPKVVFAGSGTYNDLALGSWVDVMGLREFGAMSLVGTLVMM